MSYISELNRARHLAGLEPLSEGQTLKLSELSELLEADDPWQAEFEKYLASYKEVKANYDRIRDVARDIAEEEGVNVESAKALRDELMSWASFRQMGSYYEIKGTVGETKVLMTCLVTRVIRELPAYHLLYSNCVDEYMNT